mmetsp:Transcript_34919/g.84467  ORF Transcript_34919/g.84467 Transcript_34919/m.84467 type:complete len:553 (+) Transcript_34919:986-2644(+)
MAVDEAVIDQSGSMRREESKCTRGKYMFWTLMSGEHGKELEFVVLIPTKNRKLRWKSERIHAGVHYYYTDYRYVNSGIYMKFLQYFCVLRNTKVVFFHDQASCHASMMIQLFLKSAGYEPVCPKIGGTTPFMAPPDRPKIHGALKTKAMSHFCKKFADQFRAAKAAGELRPSSHVRTMTARDLADFLVLMVDRECTPRVAKACIEECLPVISHLDADRRHASLKELMEVTYPQAVENRTTLELPEKKYTCVRCGQQYCTPNSAAARQHEDERLQKCYMYLARMPIPCTTRGVPLAPPFTVEWFGEEAPELRSAIYIRELKTNPGYWVVRYNGETKTRKWSELIKPPISFRKDADDELSFSDSSDAPLIRRPRRGGRRPASNTSSDHSGGSDNSDSDEPLIVVRTRRSGRRVQLREEEGSEQEDLLEGEGPASSDDMQSSPEEEAYSAKELDWEWPSPEELKDGTFTTVTDSRGTSVWTLYSTLDEDTYAKVACKAKVELKDGSITKEQVMKLSSSVNYDVCRHTSLRTRFQSTTILIVRFDRYGGNNIAREL